jgi:L-asparaginase II/GNAT superfamily N-acetyltransferase
LAAIVRGGAVESIHRGAIAVVDETGALRGGAGDPATQILLRSAAKPFQAAAVVASGAADAFSLSDEEIALMAASHAGTPEHVEVATRLLGRAGIPESALVCGSLEHMCSGKHAGMLLLAAHLGIPGEGYHYEEHPVQREIRVYVASLLHTGPRRPRFAAASPEAKPGSRALLTGIDGCGVPVIGMSLQDAAWLFALLAAGATSALARVRDAMLAHPVLVAGEGRLDTTLIRAGAGGIVAKGGAEGVQGIGLRVSPGGAGSLGFAVKIEDGSGRCTPVVAAALLDAWGLAGEAAAVTRGHSPLLLDRTGREVGRIEAVVEHAAVRRRPGSDSARDTRLGSRQASPPEAGRGAGPEVPRASPGKWRLFARKGAHVTVSRGDEKEVLRFLREQWPDVDREYFGRSVEWTADPYALVYRLEGEVTGVVRGHFIGGLASVDELMVKEGARGRGVGSSLLGRFEEEARRRQCSRIVLRAVKNTRAEDFYCRRGYHRECVQYGYEFGYDYVRLVRDVEGDA